MIALHKIIDNISFEEIIITASGTSLFGFERIGGVLTGEIVVIIGLDQLV